MHDFLRSRRSIRKFQQKPVDADIVERILVSGTHAPSAHNRQPWRFAILSHPEPKSRLSERITADYRAELTAEGLPESEIESRLERSRRRVEEAPLIIIPCVEIIEHTTDEHRAALEQRMAEQSVAAAIATILLAAHAEGLGAVWVCSPLFAPAAVRAALDLPESWQPQAMILVGWPNGAPKEKTLRPLQEVVRYIDR